MGGSMIDNVYGIEANCMCVKFAKEIASVEDPSVLRRGRSKEFGTYVENLMTNELSSNVINKVIRGCIDIETIYIHSKGVEAEEYEER